MSLTLISAGVTGQYASADRGADDLEVGLGLSHQHGSRCLAQLGAVKVEANAAAQVFDLLLSKAGVCTGGTAVSAVRQCLDGVAEDLRIGDSRKRVSVEHLADVVGHCLPSLCCQGRNTGDRTYGQV